MVHNQAFFMTRFTVLKPDHVRSIHLIFKFYRSRFVCYDLQPRNHPLFPDKKYHRSILGKRKILRRTFQRFQAWIKWHSQETLSSRLSSLNYCGCVSTSVSSLIEEFIVPFPGTIRSDIWSSRLTRNLTSECGFVRGKIAHLPRGDRKTAKDVAISCGRCGHSSMQRRNFRSPAFVILIVRLKAITHKIP